MTAAEHLAEAERQLVLLAEPGRGWDENEYIGAALIAQGHALIAIADGLGIAHTVPTGG